MKLYATVQSERATKGQGGNDYLFINIQDERKFSFGFVAVSIDPKNFYPTIRVFSHGGLLHVSEHEMQEIQNQAELKGEKQKTAMCTFCKNEPRAGNPFSTLCNRCEKM
jgi:hypothetical protein